MKPAKVKKYGALQLNISSRHLDKDMPDVSFLAGFLMSELKYGDIILAVPYNEGN